MKIETVIKRVVSKYPNAILQRDEEGNFFVDNGKGTDLLEEFFLPHQDDPDQAWRLAEMSIKTTKLFNRTHPDRLELGNNEYKKSRIKQRRLKRSYNGRSAR